MAKDKKSGTIKGRFSKINSDGIILIGLQQSKEYLVDQLLYFLSVHGKHIACIANTRTCFFQYPMGQLREEDDERNNKRNGIHTIGEKHRKRKKGKKLMELYQKVETENI